jgi:bacterioferritin-associated ferredoxin
MYICVCNAISDRSVRDCAAKSVSEIFRCHDARPQCGQCVSHMRRLLSDGRIAATHSILADAAD